jgi:RNA polymerase sigma-70 factor (ECF subfamily)
MSDQFDPEHPAEGETDTGLSAEALDELLPLLYQDLRRVAAAAMRGERQGHTLQPTALVHEVYLRLAGQDVRWRSRRGLLAVAGRVMRRVLVDHARAHHAAKRGGDAVRVTLVDDAAGVQPDLDLLALDQALSALAELDPRQVEIVELRYFAGLTVAETAVTLGISEATVKREWAVSRAWLLRRLGM